MSGRLGAALVANLRMLVRDRGAFFFSLLLPILFMIIFGLIFGNAGNQKLDIGLAGRGPLVQALERTPSLNVHVLPAQTAAKRVEDGRYQGAVVVEGGHATLYYSNTYAAQAAMLRGVVQGVADSVNLTVVQGAPLVSVERVSVDSSALRYIDFLVPGLLAMALSQSAVFGVAGTLVSWRERGIFRRLRVTPLPLAEFGLARLITHLTVALAQAAILLLVGRIFFGVHLGVDVPALVPLVTVGALSFIALGFLIGALARTQEAAAIAGQVITLPRSSSPACSSPSTPRRSGCDRSLASCRSRISPTASATWRSAAIPSRRRSPTSPCWAASASRWRSSRCASSAGRRRCRSARPRRGSTRARRQVSVEQCARPGQEVGAEPAGLLRLQARPGARGPAAHGH